MQVRRSKEIRPLLFLFLVLNLFFLVFRDWLRKKGIDTDVIVVANGLLVLLMLLSYWMTQKSLSSSNPNHFVRAVYGSFLLKFFVLALTAFIYIMVVRDQVNKPALYISLGMYVLYTILEVRSLQLLLRRSKNG